MSRFRNQYSDCEIITAISRMFDYGRLLAHLFQLIVNLHTLFNQSTSQIRSWLLLKAHARPTFLLLKNVTQKSLVSLIHITNCSLNINWCSYEHRCLTPDIVFIFSILYYNSPNYFDPLPICHIFQCVGHLHDRKLWSNYWIKLPDHGHYSYYYYSIILLLLPLFLLRCSKHKMHNK